MEKKKGEDKNGDQIKLRIVGAGNTQESDDVLMDKSAHKFNFYQKFLENLGTEVVNSQNQFFQGNILLFPFGTVKKDGKCADWNEKKGRGTYTFQIPALTKPLAPFPMWRPSVISDQGMCLIKGSLRMSVMSARRARRSRKVNYCDGRGMEKEKNEPSSVKDGFPSKSGISSRSNSALFLIFLVFYNEGGGKRDFNEKKRQKREKPDSNVDESSSDNKNDSQ